MHAHKLDSNYSIVAFAHQVLSEAEKCNIVLKVTGSVGVWEHCPKLRSVFMDSSRRFSDIDFVAFSKDKGEITILFQRLGFKDDPQFATIPGILRSHFYSSESGMYCDVFYDFMDFCHRIDFRTRLTVDSLTVPLMELLLQKLQIVELNLKDVYDIQLLLLEHEVGTGDHEIINVDLLAEVCSTDWGLWRTLTMNLEKVTLITSQSSKIGPTEKKVVEGKIEKILEVIGRRRKSVPWKLRSFLGTRVRWYNVVEEFSH